METERVAALGAPGGGFWGATIVCMESRCCAKPGANNPPSGVSGLLVPKCGRFVPQGISGNVLRCFSPS